MDIDFFEFENFTPSPSQSKALRQAHEELTWMSPSDSSVKIWVRKSHAIYSVRCVIRSTTGQFAAEGMSENFIPALRIMESGIQREVNRWKQTRKLLESEEQRVG